MAEHVDIQDSVIISKIIPDACNLAGTAGKQNGSPFIPVFLYLPVDMSHIALDIF